MYRTIRRSRSAYHLDPSVTGICLAGEGGGGGGGTGAEGEPKADPPKADPPKPDDKGPDADEKKFSQADLTKVAAREKAEGKRAAETKLAEDLGIPLDEAKAIIKAHQDAKEAEKSDAQRAADAANKEKDSAAAEKAAAAREVFDARVERAFLREGLDLDASDDAGKAAAARVLRMVTVEPGASFDDVHEDVKKIKADFPALFTDDAGAPRRFGAPGGDPKGTPPRVVKSEDAFSRGLDRAKGHRGAFTAVVDGKAKQDTK
jgi:hypothetical protein